MVHPDRRINAVTMHSSEALLATTDATGDTRWRIRTFGIARRGTEFTCHQQWWIPEQLPSRVATAVRPQRNRADDPFQPFGVTVLHGMEWSRLMLHLDAGLGVDAPDWLAEAP
jgi:sulfoquinovose isomerase